MDNRILISSIQIRNFRSIRNQTLECKNLNVLVGENDVGKSNVLKALNLFFCGQTDYGVDFDFQRDFTYMFPPKSHHTKEIVIEIKFLIPDTYMEKGEYIWRKTWRITGVTEEFLNSKGEKPSMRSKVPSALKKIKYRYVPAVKSKEYYKSLLSELYYTVSAVIDSPLEPSVEEFSRVLQDYTKSISDEVSNRIGLSSSLSIPENLSGLFRILVFKTMDDKGTREIPLNLRGDGIQARHIPIVLKYIADEDQKSQAKGSRVSTIWGFEEPENGVELSKAFEMARSFVDYSKNIQMLISSHSPAFYSIRNSKGSQVIYVDKIGINEGTRLRCDVDQSSIGISMGLMPLLTPFISEKEEELRRAKSIIESNGLIDTPTVFVEGITDKAYLEMAIKYYSTVLNEMIEKDKLRIYTQEGEGGCKKLSDWGKAWCLSCNKSKAVVLFDCDIAGEKYFNELNNCEIYKNKRDSAKLYVKKLKPSDEIVKVFAKHLILPFEIEHLLGISFWKAIITSSLVEKREKDELTMLVSSHLTLDKSVNDLLNALVDDVDIRETIVMHNPNSKKKMDFFNKFKKCSAEEQELYLEGIKPTLNMLEKVFVV